MYYDAIDLLKGMISRPSFSREEGETADFLKQSWEKAGYKVNRKGNNLWLIAPGFDLDKPTLLLNSHIDTVKPASGWTKDPFNPEETEDERLYGLGSNDAGASVVSLYEAFRVLSGKEQPYNLIFLASCEEEVSGKAGHAARNEGINAITLAMKDIEWFNTYQFPEKSDFLGPVKMSVTIIHAGTQHNVVPDRCEFTVDIRTNEFYPNEKLFELIKSQVGCEIKARSFRLNSTRTDLQHPFVRRAVMMGKEPFGSPTLSDQALMHFPSVKIGPGNSARSHAADEYIGLMEIREAIDMYIKLLDQLTIDN